MRAHMRHRLGDRWRRCRFAVLVGGALAMPAAAATAQPGGRIEVCAGLEAGPARTVTRIVDGETVALDDGTELRLIGALAPRAIDAGADPGMWPLEVAAQEELRALILGKSIELAFGGERADRHGRLQGQAFSMEADGRRRWVQGRLLEQGLARAYVQAGNRACGKELLRAEDTARRARRGLWADAAYRVRSADASRELMRYRSTFQVVEGRIARVAQVRGAIYLNFGANRRAFAVSLRRGDRELLLGAHVGDAKALEGKLVRVRGWIEHQRHGPTMDLSKAGLLETIEDTDLSAGRGLRTRPLDVGPPEPTPPVPKSKPPGLVETGR